MATISEIQQLYVAYFGRPADPAGLDYWVSTGISTKEFAADMYAQPEFQQVNAGLSVSQQVNALYVNLFGRQAEPAGLSYWTNLISTGKLDLATVALDLIAAVQISTNPQSQLDKIALDNKTATALIYTSDVRETSASFLAYNPTSTNPWITGPQFTSAKLFLDTATATNAPNAAAVQASVNAMTESAQRYVTVQQALLLPPGSPYNLIDSPANLGSAPSAILNGAIDISAVGIAATVAEATIIEAATNSGLSTIASLSDTATAVASSSNAVLNLVSGAVTASDAATVAQATTLAGFTHPVVYSVSDVAANIVAGAGLNDAVNIAVTDLTTVAKISIVEAAGNTGANSYNSLTDTAANLSTLANPVVSLVSGVVTASDAATVAQATTLAGFTHPVVYSVSDFYTSVQGALTTSAGQLAIADAASVTAQGSNSADNINMAAFTTKALIINSLDGNDEVIGGSLNDTITGGTGADLLTGGTGNDTFIFAVGDSFARTGTGSSTAIFANGVDVITGFTGGANAQQDSITKPLTNTGLQSVNPLGFNVVIDGTGDVFASQAGAGATDAGIKNFYIGGTWNASTNTFTYVAGAGQPDYLTFQATIDADIATSINNNATTDISALFTNAEALILDNAVFI